MLRVRVCALLGCALLLASCGATPAPEPPIQPAPGEEPRSLPAVSGVPGDPNAGARLFMSAGCAGCHTVANVPGATGVAGPNLTNIALRPTIAGSSIPTSPENLARWIEDPPSLKPGTAMPRLGLRATEARDLAAYLYSLAHGPQ